MPPPHPSRFLRARPSSGVLVALACLLLGAGSAWAQLMGQPYGSQGAVPPQTVTEAVFRSRWVGPQADRATTLVPTDSDIKPVTDWAAKLHEGLYIGSLRISPGLGLGWEYSNRNQYGTTTDGADDNSPYIAPSLGLDYTRDYGPWTVSLGYGGGYVYYVNQNFNASQSGNMRNPLNQTVRLRLGHLGVRDQTSLSASASYGNGQNIQTGGGNTTTTTVLAAFDHKHMMTEFFSTSVFASFNTMYTSYGDSSYNSGSTLTQWSGGSSVDWLATGKTTLGLKATVGQYIQAMNSTSSNDGRSYAQLMLTGEQTITSKMLLSAGLGGGYVQDSGVSDPNSQYVGFRPVYQISIKYNPSEKTSVTLSSGFEGAQITPDFRFAVSWAPRQTTSLFFSVYQDQNYSITSSSQFQVNRGIVGGINQTIFSKVSAGVSAGWQQTENQNLSTASANGGTWSYAFLSANIRWDLNDWLYWQGTLWSSTGNQYGYGSSNGGNYPQSTASIGLNLIF